MRKKKIQTCGNRWTASKERPYSFQNQKPFKAPSAFIFNDIFSGISKNLAEVLASFAKLCCSKSHKNFEPRRTERARSPKETQWGEKERKKKKERKRERRGGEVIEEKVEVQKEAQGAEGEIQILRKALNFGWQPFV